MPVPVKPTPWSSVPASPDRKSSIRANGGAATSSRRAESTAGQILALARREGMQPGDRLIEQRLADALDLSRGPIRLGLKTLEAAGLARGEPNRGFVLAQSTASRAAKSVFRTVSRDDEVYAAIATDRLDGRLSA